MKPSAALILVAALLLPELCVSQGACRYNADLSGSQVVPPTDSDGTLYVYAEFHPGMPGCGAPDVDLIIFVDQYRHLQGAPTGLLLYRGEEGTNGELLYTIFPDYFPSGAETSIEFDVGECDALKNAGTYLLVTTEAHPEGEIRGQIIEDCWAPIKEASWGRIRTKYR